MNIPVIRFHSNELHTAAEVLEQFGTPADMEGLRTFLASDRHFFLAASMGSTWAGFSIGYELVRPDGTSMCFSIVSMCCHRIAGAGWRRLC
jgi:hypothetical protein